MKKPNKTPDGLDRKGFLKGCLAAAGAVVFGSAGYAMGTRGKTSEIQRPAPEREVNYPLALTLTGTIPSGLKNLRGVAWGADGKLYAGGKEGVAVFAPLENSYPKIKRQILLKTSDPVTAVAVDDEGNVYAASRTGITVFDKDGKQTATWGERGEQKGQFSFITGLAVDSPVVAVADAGRRTVLRFAINGDLVDEITGFHVPSPYFSVAYDKKGLLHVAHPGKHCVEVYDSTGERVHHWGRYGTTAEYFTGCCNPTNIAVLSDGRIVTTEKGTPRLKVLAADEGKAVLAFIGPDAFAPRVAGMDLAVGPEDRIALADVARNEIRLYALSQRKNEE